MRGGARKGAGRPRGSGKNGERRVSMSVSVLPSQKEKIKENAKKAKKSVSRLVLDALKICLHLLGGF